MRQGYRLSAVCYAMLLYGCGSAAPAADSGASAPDGDTAHADSGAPVDAAMLPAADAAPVEQLDANPHNSDASSDPACTPSTGSASAGAYCDQFHLALVDDGAGMFSARLTGRLMPEGLAALGCATVDSIEVQEAGVTIGTLAGAGILEHTAQHALLAQAPALPEMSARCADDANRFGGFGFIVHGRMDGGTFEAHCAAAEGGSRWPPALVVTCHNNVDEPARYGTATIDQFSGQSFTTVDAVLPHGPAGAITTVNSTARVIPHGDPFGFPVPEPFTIAGMEGTVTENSSDSYSLASLWRTGDALGTELCPAPGEPTESGWPVMLIRFSGSGARGAYSTEAYVDMCWRNVAPARKR